MFGKQNSGIRSGKSVIQKAIKHPNTFINAIDYYRHEMNQLQCVTNRKRFSYFSLQKFRMNRSMLEVLKIHYPDSYLQLQFTKTFFVILKAVL